MIAERKLLILGASSFVGRHLWYLLGEDLAIGTYNNTAIPDCVYFNVLTMGIADLGIDPHKVSAAVILLGDTQPDSCAANVGKSNALNVDSVKRVINELKELRIPIIFTSSEFVFDGTRGDYTEDDAPRPIMIYGAQKLEVERYLKRNGGEHCILRLAKVYGEELADGSLFTGFLKQIESEKALRCASDQRFSPIYVFDVCDAILRVVKTNLRGTYHLAGPQGLSRLECLNTIAKVLRRHKKVKIQIEPCSIHDFPLSEPRPVDVSMRPDKLVQATGLRLQTVLQSCERIVSSYMLNVKPNGYL